jgi:predicted small lipoprotein YifL
MRSLIILTALFMLLSGCGKKGNLYLPSPAEPARSTSGAAPTPSSI